MILSLIESNRSFRRFDGAYSIPRDTFSALANAVRLSSSAGNLQRIRLLFVSSLEECESVFDTLSFAAYLKDWDGPDVEQRPSGYAVILTEKEPDGLLFVDIGIAAQSMLLTAREFGLGGCIFGSFSKEKLVSVLDLKGYVPALVIALGVPAETVRITDVKNGDIKYYRDEGGVHVVPKRDVKDIVIREF